MGSSLGYRVDVGGKVDIYKGAKIAFHQHMHQNLFSVSMDCG